MTRGKPLSFDRELVLKKAMEKFWTRGYEGIGMTELLDQMGIQRQSFYNTFGSKRDVFLEAIDLYGKSVLSKITDELEREGNPIENIERVFQFWEDTMKKGHCFGCFIGNSIAEFGPHDQELRVVLKLNLEMLESAFSRTLKKAIDEGYISKENNPKTLARSIVAMSQGLALLSRLGLEAETLNDAMKPVRELLKR